MPLKLCVKCWFVKLKVLLDLYLEILTFLNILSFFLEYEETFHCTKIKTSTNWEMATTALLRKLHQYERRTHLLGRVALAHSSCAKEGGKVIKEETKLYKRRNYKNKSLNLSSKKAGYRADIYHFTSCLSLLITVSGVLSLKSQIASFLTLNIWEHKKQRLVKITIFLIFETFQLFLASLSKLGWN